MKINYVCKNCGKQIESTKPLSLKDGCPHCKGPLKRTFEKFPEVSDGFTDADVRFAQDMIFTDGGAS